MNLQNSPPLRNKLRNVVILDAIHLLGPYAPLVAAPLFRARMIDPHLIARASLVLCSAHEALVSSHTDHTFLHC